jgi:high-affinity iron transporter
LKSVFNLAEAALRLLLPVFCLVVAIAAVGTRPAAAAGDPEEHARRAIHLLAYISADYPGAVQNGQVVSDLEYREQLDFAAAVREQFGSLGVASGDPLLVALDRFDADLHMRAPADAIGAQANALAAAVRDRFRVRALPPRTPDLARGAALYATACASCHGAEGAGDGPAGRGLDPAPASFRDAARAASLSPFALFSTITYGIAGTGMLGFEATLDEAARWDLAYFVGSLGFAPDEIARGAAQLAATPAARVPDLAQISHHSAAELIAADAAAAPLIAHLRANPSALRSGALPLEIARTRLADSLDAFQRGEAARALELATSSYLDGFEHVEPALSAVDDALRMEIEVEYVRYRAALRSGAAPAEIEAIQRSLGERLATAEAQLARGGLGTAAVFAGALTILAREGLEAVLLVVAILGVLARAGRSDAARFVHAGWIGALVAGAATWWIASRLVAVSGARREVIEGVSALLATAILFYISYWLLSKTQAARWQAFLDDRFRAALSRGSLWMLAGLSFVAVYREAFETVLFFQALAAQAGPEGRNALLAGIGAGVALLAVLATSVFRLGQRLPLRRFFAASSVLLYALAVVLAGHGVAALQEAGWIPATPASFFRFEWLGIYPTWQGLALQVALLLAAIAALPLLAGGLQREPRQV